MSSFIAAGSAHSAHQVNMIPFFIYYSMFGFQRIGDLIWAAGDIVETRYKSAATAECPGDTVHVVALDLDAAIAQTGDGYVRLGAPAGASVSADVAAVKADTAAILVDSGTTLDGRIPAALVGGRMDASVGAVAANAITAAGIADGAIDAATFAAGAIDAAAIAPNAIGASELAADAVLRVIAAKASR